MKFRKDSLSFYQSEIAYIAMIILSVLLIKPLGLMHSLLFMLPFVVLTLINPIIYSEAITVDEGGISCSRFKKQLWEYKWNNVAQLKKSSRFLMPSIEIIGYNEYGEIEQYALTSHYFQFGKTAKKAIERERQGTVPCLDKKKK